MIRRALVAGGSTAIVLSFLGADANAQGSSPPKARVRVAVGIYLRNLAAINEREESVSLMGDLLARWNDPRLAYRPSGPDVRERVLDVDKIWTPHFLFANSRTPREVIEKLATVAPDGTVSYSDRFSADLSAVLHLRHFPFDSQVIDVFVQSFVYDKSALEFVADPHLSGHAKDAYALVAQWKILGTDTGISIGRSGPQSREFSRFDFHLRLKRHTGFYIWKIILPLLLIIIIGWGSLWIDFHAVDGAISLAVTSLLSAVAYSFTINSDLPRVSYTTFIDGFIFLCYMIVFTTIVAVVTTHAIDRTGRHEQGLRYQAAARWIVPAIFVVSMIVLLVFTR